MNKRITLCLIILSISFFSICQSSDEYQVFAVKFCETGKMPAQNCAIGANPTDTVHHCFMVWLLKGENGRNILVDAGFIDTSEIGMKNYVRPDLVLQRIDSMNPSNITDIILTHPHFDHIGGINLFPKADIWIQKDDFEYFIGEAWQDDKSSKYFRKNDVHNIIEINLQGRLKLIDGDDLEIFPGIRVYTGSKHTFENQYLLVNSNSKTNKVLIASDAVWFYYNLTHLLPVTLSMDSKAYVEAMKRMKTLVTNPDLIIPGHDDLVFTKFPEVTEWIVRIR